MVESEQTKGEFAPEGAAGGRKGAPARLSILGADGTERILPAKGEYVVLPDEILRLDAGGGGGYGDPAQRDPNALEMDVLSGLVSPETARRDYGFVARDSRPKFN